MCGRFVMNHPPHLLQKWYEAVMRASAFPPRYNIAPGSAIQVVRALPGEREISLMRWGFIPSWADNPATVPMLHNARAETVAEKPMFRQSFRRRRCLVPASGFYEWKAVPGKKTKQPYYLSLRDGTPLSFAAVWDSATMTNGQIVETCAIVTTKANALVEAIHQRMPVFLDREHWNAWLDGETPVADILAMLQPYSSERMQAWEVAEDVNRAVNDNPSLLQPLTGATGVQPALL